MGENMHVVVAAGTRNPTKLKAVENGFLHYFEKVVVKSFDVESGVHHQPKCLEEMVTGASNRAKAAFEKCGNADYGVGIESGLISVPSTSKHLTTGLTVIFDGKNSHVGIAPAFELPLKVVKKVLNEDSELGSVIDELVGRKDVKHSEGAVGVLSKGKFTRDKMLELGVALALVPIVSKELFE